MDKTITTTFMIIISIVVTVMVFNAVYPAVIRSSDALNSMRGRMDERLQSQLEIVHAAGELDGSESWQDTDSDGQFDVFVWVKNVGSVRIPAVEQVDVFFGPDGEFVRIPSAAEAGGAFPNWSWSLENSSRWDPTATLKITINYNVVLGSNRYYVKVVAPNGASDVEFFGM